MRSSSSSETFANKTLTLLEQLIKISFTCDKMEIVKLMKQIVPEFISINSEFEVLDKHWFYGKGSYVADTFPVASYNRTDFAGKVA